VGFVLQEMRPAAAQAGEWWQGAVFINLGCHLIEDFPNYSKYSLSNLIIFYMFVKYFS
jgi:hypothetical protein